MYIGQRLFLIVFTVLAVSSIVFLGIHRLPGDALFSERLRGQEYQILLHRYGLDLPLPTQYFNFLGAMLHGDLGESLVSRGVKITPLVVRELAVSAVVGFVALFFTIVIGIILGTI